MRRTLLAASLLGGCSFLGPTDALPTSGVPDAGRTSARSCSATSDPQLKLCLDFENPQPTTVETDGSGFGNNATVANLSMMTGHQASAARLGTSSSILVPKNADLDPTDQVSVELWLQPDGMPATGGQWWMLDNNTEYGITLWDDGELHCVIGSDTVNSNVNTIHPDGLWHHAACVYDHTNLEVFVDGVLSGCQPLTKAIKTTGIAGTAIGANLSSSGGLSDHFLGGLDSVRVFARALGASEVCLEATGGTACNATCPPPQGWNPPGGLRSPPVAGLR